MLLLVASVEKVESIADLPNTYNNIISEELIADPSDFNYPWFQNSLGQMIFWSDEGLRIHGKRDNGYDNGY